MKIAILGFGREGQSVLKYLQNRGLTRIATQMNADTDNEIWILDKNKNIKNPRGVKAQLGKNYLKNLDRFDIIFRSPGIPYELPELKAARRAGVTFSSATKLFFQEIARLKPQTSNLKPHIIGITGTKGKGTTSILLYKILRAAKKQVFLAGNIGKPALDILPRLSALSQRKSAFIVLELSSFQLQDLSSSPHIAAVLDVFPDHQDSHRSLAEYYGAKANIAKHQRRAEKIFFFAHNPISRSIAEKSPGKKIAVDPSATLRTGENKFTLFGPQDLKIPGRHNFKNATMAATVALKLGVPAKTIVKTVKSFRGLPHRLQLMRTIITKARQPYSNVLKNIRIRFYNDSAAVNPGATIAALQAVGKNTILIAGGKERGLNYSNLAKTIKKYVKFVVLMGENEHKLAKAIKAASPKGSVKIEFARSIEEAVRMARQAANPGDTILFSPASASFDMFKNYEERGEIFTKVVGRITKKRHGK